ncbi:hypothetical protein JCM11491_001829 [Sporobolomyces phaffii]
MSDPRLVPLLRGYTALDQSQLAESQSPVEVAQGLASGAWKLIEVVKALQDSLTSENDKVRSRGVGLLSAVVEHMDKSSLDRQSTKVLTTFFTTKLADPASLVACATALAGLSSSPSFGTLEGVEVVQGLFSSVTFKNVAQSIRYKVYLLVDALMANSRPALKRLSAPGFLKPYCELVEGEKDPRNLMISFGLIKVMLLEFEIESVVADLFDITFCYFPITFTPPPDDPYGIKSEDLISALRACLSSTPAFGPLALPLFLDKLQASSEKAKRQTLAALCECFPIYGAQVVGEWAGRFSEALSIEVFHATDSGMQDLALETFHALFNTLYPDPAPRDGEGEDVVMEDSTKDDTVKGIAVQVVKNCLDEVDEPEKSNAKPATRILVTLAAASKRLGRYVLNQTVPRLVAFCQNPEELALRPAALCHLATLLASLSPPSSLVEPADAGLPPSLASSSSTLDFSPSAPTPSPLNPHLDTLLSLFTSSIRTSADPSTRLPALTGLVSLIKLDQFLSGPEVDYCVSTFNDILSPSTPSSSSSPQEDEPNDQVYDLALSNVIECSKRFPKAIERSTLPLLFGSLPTPSSPSDEPSKTPGGRGYQKSLSALAAICSLSSSPDLFETLATTLSSILEQAVSLPLASPSSQASDNTTTLYAHDLLSTLRSVVRVKVTDRASASQRELEKLFENGFVTKLLDMFISPTTVQPVVDVVAMDLRLLVDVGKILSLIFATVSTERQATFYQTVDDAFQRGQLEALLARPVDATVAFAPLSATSPVCQQNLSTLYTAVLLPLDPRVPLAAADLSRLVKILLSRALEATNELQLRASLFGLANVVNKRVDHDSIQRFLDDDLQAFWNENVIADDATSKRTRLAGLRVASWIAKGLVVRSHERGYKMVDALVELMGHADGDLTRHAARELGVIADADDRDRVLSKENFSVIRLLWKQRFFTFLLPKLVDAHKQRTSPSSSPATADSAPPSSSAVYLIALSSLLHHLPKQLALTELPKLLPLLITALDLPDAHLRANVIDTLAVIVREAPALVEPSITSIATKALKSAVADSAPLPSLPQSPGAIKLRISCLRFLALLPAQIPYLVLHPHKATVLKQLGVAVDDPKKDVRRAAVECRSAWYNYN